LSDQYLDKLVVVDSGPLIALSIMELLPVLNKLFKKTVLPQAVLDECLHDVSKPQSESIQFALDKGWVTKKSISSTAESLLLAEILDPGEAQAISLAKELDALALIDEKAGRKVARREKVQCIGSLFVLIKAKQGGHIQQVQPALQRLIDHGYFLDKSLIDYVLTVSKEKSKN